MKMPFGRYSGVEVGDLPSDYLEWLHALGTLRKPLHAAVDMECRARFGPTQRNPGVPSPEVRTMATEIVAVGYRKLAHVHHPDHDGDERAMQMLNAAAEWLRLVTREKS